MNVRKILLWGLPLLFVGVLIFSVLLQSQEKNYYTIRQKGWTYYEGKHGAPTTFSYTQGKHGDMVIDEAGRIWAAPGCYGLFGLHTFDGNDWNTRDGYYRDLALSPQGQVWALKCATGFATFINNEGQRWEVWETQLEVYDGQEWTTYGMGDLGIPYNPQDAPISMKEITQVEVDSHGNIWVVTNYKGEEEVIEIIPKKDDDRIRFSLGQQKSFGKTIVNSLDTDDQGRVWVAVENRGISVFDNGEWKQISGYGVNLQKVVRIVFDNQGHPWVGTACGGIMRYENKEWVTIVEDTKDGACGIKEYKNKQVRKIEGITFDNQERVWSWNDDGIQLINGNTLTTLTSENSGLAGTGFFGVVIDDQNQVWIGRSTLPYYGEVSMVDMKDAQPISEEIVKQHNRLSPIIDYFSEGGMTWFLGSLIVILWIAAFLNAILGVLIAIILGLLSLFLGPPTIYDHGFPTDYPVTNPGVYATYVGVLGGLIGSHIDIKVKKSKRAKWAPILGASAWVIIFGAFMCLWLFLPK